MTGTGTEPSVLRRSEGAGPCRGAARVSSGRFAPLRSAPTGARARRRSGRAGRGATARSRAARCRNGHGSTDRSGGMSEGTVCVREMAEEETRARREAGGQMKARCVVGDWPSTGPGRDRRRYGRRDDDATMRGSERTIPARRQCVTSRHTNGRRGWSGACGGDRSHPPDQGLSGRMRSWSGQPRGGARRAGPGNGPGPAGIPAALRTLDEESRAAVPARAAARGRAR